MKEFLDNHDHYDAKLWTANSTTQFGLHRQGYGTQIFKNGVRAVGNFVNGNLEGYAKIIIPEGTELEGIFIKNRFSHGTITYFNKVKVKCSYTLKNNSMEDCCEYFEIHFPSGYKVIGKCRSSGAIDQATVYDPSDKQIAEYQGDRLQHLISDQTYIVIAKSWVFEGAVRTLDETTSKNSNAIEFGDFGCQIWLKGFGYFQITQNKNKIIKRLLRVYKSVFLLRETIAQNNEIIFSSSCYSNGYFFVTHETLNDGVLLLFLEGKLVRVPCSMQDFIGFIGHIVLPFKEPIKFTFKKNKLNRYEFTHKNKKLNTGQLEKILMDYLLSQKDHDARTTRTT